MTLDLTAEAKACNSLFVFPNNLIFPGVPSLSMPSRMTTPCVLSYSVALFLISIATQLIHGQSPAPVSILSQMSQAFSGGQVVQQVSLNGSATWYAGSLEDTGTVSLTATADGSSQMQLSLSATGNRTESQSGKGTNAVCQWAGNDGVTHSIDLGNCWRPALWFLPMFSLQASLTPSELGLTDLGSEAVGSSGDIYRHLKTQLRCSTFPKEMASHLTRRSTTELGLDPVSFQPAVLMYSLNPDNGAQLPSIIEIHYSDYRVVNGVQIPFLIQRYINGSLQLQITINAAQIG
jgi:hypothetical protein